MIKLPSELTIAHLDEYQSKILPIIDNKIDSKKDGPQIIEIDDSQLTRIDTLGVQFILAVITYIIAQGKEIKWQSNSAVLRESIHQLGITDAILLQYILD